MTDPKDSSDKELARVADLQQVIEPLYEEEAKLNTEDILLTTSPPVTDPAASAEKTFPAPDYSDADDPHAKENAPDYDPLPPPAKDDPTVE